MDLLRTSHPDQPVVDMTLTDELLREVGQGRREAVIRVFRPGPTVAFGRADRHRPGFNRAEASALAHGRTPVVRLAGGQAAAYDGGCVLVEVIQPAETIFGGAADRYEELAELTTTALADCGVELVLGELPGEYCPGRYSLHLPAGPKIAGIAQRSIRGAALTTAVIVVEGGDELRATISDVYAALELPLDPRAVGAVTDGHPDVTPEAVADAIVARAGARFSLVPASWAGTRGLDVS